eukprot:XP_001692694.1 predicted protein [Chlamydomonas reinhardtii]
MELLLREYIIAYLTLDVVPPFLTTSSKMRRGRTSGNGQGSSAHSSRINRIIENLEYFASLRESSQAVGAQVTAFSQARAGALTPADWKAADGSHGRLIVSLVGAHGWAIRALELDYEREDALDVFTGTQHWAVILVNLMPAEERKLLALAFIRADTLSLHARLLARVLFLAKSHLLDSEGFWQYLQDVAAHQLSVAVLHALRAQQHAAGAAGGASDINGPDMEAWRLGFGGLAGRLTNLLGQSVHARTQVFKVDGGALETPGSQAQALAQGQLEQAQEPTTAAVGAAGGPCLRPSAYAPAAEQLRLLMSLCVWQWLPQFLFLARSHLLDREDGWQSMQAMAAHQLSVAVLHALRAQQRAAGAAGAEVQARLRRLPVPVATAVTGNTTSGSSTTGAAATAAATAEAGSERGVVLCGNPACANTDGPSALFPASGGKTCARCKAVWYCCGACQLAHWQQRGGHREACSKAQGQAQGW